MHSHPRHSCFLFDTIVPFTGVPDALLPSVLTATGVSPEKFHKLVSLVGLGVASSSTIYEDIKVESQLMKKRLEADMERTAIDCTHTVGINDVHFFAFSCMC